MKSNKERMSDQTSFFVASAFSLRYSIDMKSNKQVSESVTIALLLGLAGGFIDAYTYISRGNVFAFAQTGNMIYLGMSLARGNFAIVLKYLIPIIAFSLGVLVTEIIRDYFKNHQYIHWRQIIILLECLLLGLTVFVPQGDLNLVVTTLISFVCAMQVESFRKVNGNPFSSTMCTGNLRSGVENIFHAFYHKDKRAIEKSLSYFGIIVCFIIGAWISTMVHYYLGVKTILCSLGIYLIVFMIMFIKPLEE